MRMRLRILAVAMVGMLLVPPAGRSAATGGDSGAQAVRPKPGGPAGPSGRIMLSFPTDRAQGRAIVTGTLGGRHLHLRLFPPWTSEG